MDGSRVCNREFSVWNPEGEVGHGKGKWGQRDLSCHFKLTAGYISGCGTGLHFQILQHRMPGFEEWMRLKTKRIWIKDSEGGSKAARVKTMAGDWG